MLPGNCRLFLSSLACVIAAALPTGLAAHTGFAATTTNQLYRFDTGTPGAFSSVAITGLGAGEQIVGLDFRPLTQELLGLGSQSRLYVINTSTGAATQVGSNGAFTLSGTSFGFDVNPAADRIRVVSDTEQNVRLNPTTGALAAADTNLAYAVGDPNFGQNPNVVGSAYTNSFAGATTTVLYGIDSNLDILVTQVPPNNGTLNTVGPLGVNTSGAVGFDIVSDGGGDTAYALLQGGSAVLYRINLGTGAATALGAMDSLATFTAFAVAPNARLINIATRGVVLGGENVLIAGFVVQNPGTVIVRARGPSLASAGVQGALSNPQLQLFSGSTQIAYNDNWGDAANAAAVQGSGFAPASPLEAAILTSLNPGAYTAIVTGVGGVTGVAIVEVFVVP